MITSMRVPSWLGWLFFLFPVLELLVYWRVSLAIGFGNAVLATLAAGVLGVQLMRGAALGGTALNPRDLPGLLLGQGFRLLAGLLFLIPGFVSDALALLCLLPVVRQALLRRAAPAAAEPEARHESVTETRDTARTRTGGRTVDGEFERMDE